MSALFTYLFLSHLTMLEKIIIGHYVGDFLFQPKTMALKKSSPGSTGLAWCLVHCLIYTAAVCLFTSTVQPLKIGLIFLSHFPVDRWSLANYWLQLIKGRNLLKAYESRDKYHEIDLAFSALVYERVDSLIHILLMLPIFNCL
jgi:hypothetical protein